METARNRSETPYVVSYHGLRGLRHWPWACGLLLIVWVYYILTPILSRRHYRQYKAMHEEFTVELLDEGLRFTSVNSDIRIPWANIIKWRHNETCILIYQMPRLYGVVPKSVAARGFDVALLISRLTEQVGKAS
jgi:hypothetical protein